MKKMRLANFVVGVETYELLRKTADAEERSVSSLIRLILTDWHERQQKVPLRQHRKQSDRLETRP
jgi:hypothetical protein